METKKGNHQPNYPKANPPCKQTGIGTKLANSFASPYEAIQRKISLETQRLPDGTFIQDRPSDNPDQDTQDITNF